MTKVFMAETLGDCSAESFQQGMKFESRAHSLRQSGLMVFHSIVDDDGIMVAVLHEPGEVSIEDVKEFEEGNKRDSDTLNALLTFREKLKSEERSQEDIEKVNVKIRELVLKAFKL